MQSHYERSNIWYKKLYDECKNTSGATSGAATYSSSGLLNADQRHATRHFAFSDHRSCKEVQLFGTVDLRRHDGAIPDEIDLIVDQLITELLPFDRSNEHALNFDRSDHEVLKLLENTIKKVGTSALQFSACASPAINVHDKPSNFNGNRNAMDPPFMRKGTDDYTIEDLAAILSDTEDNEQLKDFLSFYAAETNARAKTPAVDVNFQIPPKISNTERDAATDNNNSAKYVPSAKPENTHVDDQQQGQIDWQQQVLDVSDHLNVMEKVDELINKSVNSQKSSSNIDEPPTLPVKKKRSIVSQNGSMGMNTPSSLEIDEEDSDDEDSDEEETGDPDADKDEKPKDQQYFTIEMNNDYQFSEDDIYLNEAIMQSMCTNASTADPKLSDKSQGAVAEAAVSDQEKKSAVQLPLESTNGKSTVDAFIEQMVTGIEVNILNSEKVMGAGKKAPLSPALADDNQTVPMDMASSISPDVMLKFPNQLDDAHMDFYMEQFAIDMGYVVPPTADKADISAQARCDALKSTQKSKKPTVFSMAIAIIYGHKLFIGSVGNNRIILVQRRLGLTDCIYLNEPSDSPVEAATAAPPDAKYLNVDDELIVRGGFEIDENSQYLILVSDGVIKNMREIERLSVNHNSKIVQMVCKAEQIGWFSNASACILRDLSLDHHAYFMQNFKFKKAWHRAGMSLLCSDIRHLAPEKDSLVKLFKNGFTIASSPAKPYMSFTKQNVKDIYENVENEVKCLLMSGANRVVRSGIKEQKSVTLPNHTSQAPSMFAAKNFTPLQNAVESQMIAPTIFPILKEARSAGQDVIRPFSNKNLSIKLRYQRSLELINCHRREHSISSDLLWPSSFLKCSS